MEDLSLDDYDGTLYIGEARGAFLVVGLDREICDLALVGSNSRDKGGT